MLGLVDITNIVKTGATAMKSAADAVISSFSQPTPQGQPPESPVVNDSSVTGGSTGNIAAATKTPLNERRMSDEAKGLASTPRRENPEAFRRLLVGQGIEIDDVRGLTHVIQRCDLTVAGESIVYIKKMSTTLAQDDYISRQFFEVNSIDDAACLVDLVKDILKDSDVSGDVIENVINNLHSENDGEFAVNATKLFVNHQLEDCFVGGENSAPKLVIELGGSVRVQYDIRFMNVFRGSDFVTRMPDESPAFRTEAWLRYESDDSPTLVHLRVSSSDALGFEDFEYGGAGSGTQVRTQLDFTAF